MQNRRWLVLRLGGATCLWFLSTASLSKLSSFCDVDGMQPPILVIDRRSCAHGSTANKCTENLKQGGAQICVMSPSDLSEGADPVLVSY